MNTKENVLCEERKGGKEKAALLREYKYWFEVESGPLRVWPQHFRKLRGDERKSEEKEDGGLGMMTRMDPQDTAGWFGRRPMSGGGFVTLSV